MTHGKLERMCGEKQLEVPECGVVREKTGVVVWVVSN